MKSVDRCPRGMAPIGRAAALSLLLCAPIAYAHESATTLMPEQPGLRLGVSTAVFVADADHAWPTPNWPGVLTTGGSFADQRSGLTLEHGAFDVAARLHENLGVFAGVGWHDRDGAHVEAAGLMGRWTLDGGELEAQLGRNAVLMGQTLDRAGNSDAFAQPPLIKRAALDDDWIEDGLTLIWRLPNIDGLQSVSAGLLSGRKFPGGQAGPLVPTVLLTGAWGEVGFDLFAARLQPEGRGAEKQSAGTTVSHTHGMPSCQPLAAQAICFDGRSDVVAAAARWRPDRWSIGIDIAGLLRRDRGQLYGTSGAADYRATIQGGWLQLEWHATERVHLTTRFERLTTDHDLNGVGASLLARDGGLVDAGPVERFAAGVSYAFAENLSVGLELGRERSAGQANRYALLRMLWSGSALWSF